MEPGPKISKKCMILESEARIDPSLPGPCFRYPRGRFGFNLIGNLEIMTLKFWPYLGFLDAWSIKDRS